MLTKKHLRPQVSSKVPLTMGEKNKPWEGRAAGRWEHPISTVSHLPEGTCHNSSSQEGSAGPTCPALPAWEDFPAMAWLGNGQH